MTHDRDHRRPFHEHVVAVREDRFGDRLVLGVDDVHLLA